MIDYLYIIGPKLGCHFTLELQAPASGRPPKIFNVIKNDQNIASIPQLISKLHRDMGGFTVEHDSKNPKIVHIIVQALGKDKSYVLNKKINLKYSGNIQERAVWDSECGYFIQGGGLFDAASKEAPGIWDQTEASGNWVGCGDYVTKVTINATNETVRSIFTDCVPLADYSPVLWSAVATKEAGKPRVWVLFGGPKKP